MQSCNHGSTAAASCSGGDLFKNNYRLSLYYLQIRNTINCFMNVSLHFQDINLDKENGSSTAFEETSRSTGQTSNVGHGQETQPSVLATPAQSKGRRVKRVIHCSDG